MNEITIIKPDDFHNHLRQGDLMTHLVKETAKVFARTLVMPNLVPPITTPEDIQRYHNELKAVGTDLEFLMTFKVMPDTDPNSVSDLKTAGAIVGKLYPMGVSTHSEDGVQDINALFPLFEAMQQQDLVLCIHGEMPEVDDMKAEEAFLPTLIDIHQNFPTLRIVLEHVSTKAAVTALESLPNTVGATVSVHHLLLTIDDVRKGDHIQPHHYCRPLCKTEGDRLALLEVVMAGNPRYFLGTDSAPHVRESKEVVGEPMRGVYTTPVAMPLLAQLFEENDRLAQLQAFSSEFGADFYQIPQNNSELQLLKKAWTVPEEYFGVVPLSAGEQLRWQVTTQ